MGRLARLVARAGGAVLVAAAAAVWPGPGAGQPSGPPAGWPAAPAALAWDEWCDSDPVLLIRTPAGTIVPVYYLTGVQGPTHLVGGLLGNLSATYTAEPAGGGTRVTVRVTVPNGLLGATYATRLTVSSGPLGTGDVYGATTGRSGEADAGAVRPRRALAVRRGAPTRCPLPRERPAPLSRPRCPARAGPVHRRRPGGSAGPRRATRARTARGSSRIHADPAGAADAGRGLPG